MVSFVNIHSQTGDPAVGADVGTRGDLEQADSF